MNNTQKLLKKYLKKYLNGLVDYIKYKVGHSMIAYINMTI